LRYSQKKCGSRFSDGRPIMETLEQLNTQRVDTLRAPWLKLSCVQRHDGLYSIDNRRLWCLKRHRDHVQEDVEVRIRMIPDEVYKECQRFTRNHDAQNGGHEITVRGEGPRPRRHNNSNNNDNNNEEIRVRSYRHSGRGRSREGRRSGATV
ncbi:unnamed protein product, partial [Polarella glacialis]